MESEAEAEAEAPEKPKSQLLEVGEEGGGDGTNVVLSQTEGEVGNRLRLLPKDLLLPPVSSSGGGNSTSSSPPPGCCFWNEEEEDGEDDQGLRRTLDTKTGAQPKPVRRRRQLPDRTFPALQLLRLQTLL